MASDSLYRDIMSNNEQDVHLVELRDLTKTFPLSTSAFTALDRIDLRFGQGEFVAIVGKSGSGKSTLMNMIAGIDRPTAGEVRVAGVRLNDLKEGPLAAWRGRTVGVVFQAFQLLPTLTIAENVMLPIDFGGTLRRRQARERAISLLRQVEIVNQADKFPAALSGGQQQRAAIARALANDPPLIVADEPTGNLDSQTARAVLALFAQLTKAGKTVLLVTHERDVASVVDRVVTLVDGKVASDRPARPTANRDDDRAVTHA